MLLNKIANANGTVISVTGTATLLKDLINTAGVTNTTYSGNINAADLYIEDGDVRVLYDGNTPTASKGILLKQGTTYQFRRTPIDKLRLISTSGTVLVDVQVGFSEQGESTNSSNSSIVTLTGDVEIGAVELKNASDDTRVKVGALTSITSADNGLPITDPIANTVLGTTSGSAVETDASGTIQQYLRGLVKLIVSKITVILNDLSPANSGRTATSQVLPVQVLGADGAILPAVPVLGAGTAAIGKLAANSGVDIGDVDVTSISAGETHIGQAGGYASIIATEFTRTADTNAYTANDVLQTATSGATMLSWAAAARKNAGMGYITGIEVIGDQSAEVWQPKIHVQQQARAVVLNDNEAFAATYAMYGGGIKLIGDVTLPVLSAYGTTAKSRIDGLAIPFLCNTSDAKLYFDLQTLTAFTPVSGAKYTIKLYTIQL